MFSINELAWLLDTSFYKQKPNLEETKNDYVFTFVLPGRDKNDIKVSIKNTRLIISAAATEAPINEKELNLSIQLPDNVTNVGEASLKNGILTVRIKKKDSSPDTILKIN